MRMTRIEMPDFAPDYARRAEVHFYDGVTLAQYQQVQAHREGLLAAVHRALEAHLAERALDRPDLFPYRGALTGEYYLGLTEHYGLDGSPQGVSVMMQARCLGKRRGQVGDYAAVDVTLLFHPAEGTFTTVYTGTHVI